jgi:hypothetical protein
MHSPVDGLSDAPTLAAAAAPFSNGTEHLLASLEALKHSLHFEVLRLRARGQLVENDFRGLFISDEQIDATLEERPDSPRSSHAAAVALEALATSPTTCSPAQASCATTSKRLRSNSPRRRSPSSYLSPESSQKTTCCHGSRTHHRRPRPYVFVS